jgi:hypothetical protein
VLLPTDRPCSLFFLSLSFYFSLSLSLSLALALSPVMHQIFLSFVVLTSSENVANTQLDARQYLEMKENRAKKLFGAVRPIPASRGVAKPALAAKNSVHATVTKEKPKSIVSLQKSAAAAATMKQAVSQSVTMKTRVSLLPPGPAAAPKTAVTMRPVLAGNRPAAAVAKVGLLSSGWAAVGL